MRRRRSDPEAEEGPEEAEGEDEPTSPPEKAAPPPRRHRGHRSPRPVRAWDDDAPSKAGDDGEPESPARPGRRKRPKGDEDEAGEAPKERIYFRARDAWWFEIVVAVMIIVVLLVSLYAYTSNWPPVYVVESESMQHGYDDHVGLINTGDLVLAQHVDTSTIVPYVVGLQTGYSTYGEYGDVVLYYPNGNLTDAPIIHRALFFVQYNPNGSYSIPELQGLPCGNNISSGFYYEVSQYPSGCGTVGLRGSISLYDVGWQGTEVDLPLDTQLLGKHSGFVTMGDNNFQDASDTAGITDQYGSLSSLVSTNWIIGVARGMIPWAGAIKLALDSHAGEVPPQSWQYLGLTVVALFAAGLGIHLFLRREGYEDDRRRLREAQGAEEGEEADTPAEGKPRRGLRFWSSGAAKDDPEADDDAPARSSSKGKRHSGKETVPDDKSDEPSEKSPRGRPPPKVGRRPPPAEYDDGL